MNENEFRVPDDLTDYVCHIAFEANYSWTGRVGRSSNPVPVTVTAFATPRRGNQSVRCGDFRMVRHEEKSMIVPTATTAKGPCWPTQDEYIESADSYGVRKIAYSRLIEKVRREITEIELKERIKGVQYDVLAKIVLEAMRVSDAESKEVKKGKRDRNVAIGERIVELLQPIVDGQVPKQEEPKKLGDFRHEIRVLSMRMSEIAGVQVVLRMQIMDQDERMATMMAGMPGLPWIPPR